MSSLNLLYHLQMNACVGIHVLRISSPVVAPLLFHYIVHKLWTLCLLSALGGTHWLCLYICKSSPVTWVLFNFWLPFLIVVNIMQAGIGIPFVRYLQGVTVSIVYVQHCTTMYKHTQDTWSTTSLYLVKCEF